MNLTFEEYQKKYINIPLELRGCRIYEADKNKMVYLSYDKLTEKQTDNCPMMLPIGRKDDDGIQIFTGDIVYVEIETKYDLIKRLGVVRADGLTCCGIDYINKEGLITEEGDFIDEFFISRIFVIGDVYCGMRRSMDDFK